MRSWDFKNTDSFLHAVGDVNIGGIVPEHDMIITSHSHDLGHLFATQYLTSWITGTIDPGGFWFRREKF